MIKVFQKLNPAFLLILAIIVVSCSGDKKNAYEIFIENGEFSKAQENISNLLATNNNLSSDQRSQLFFQIERMERIKKDFTKSEKDVFDYIKNYIPDVTEENLSKWEKDKSLEFKTINGEKKYFKYAARNLFRIDEECKNIWDEYNLKRYGQPPLPDEDINLGRHNLKIMEIVSETGQKYVLPVKLSVNYSIAVDPNLVPDGEIIRCWLPFPREIPGRQVDIKLIATEPDIYKLADKKYLQRTIYFEKKAIKDKKTKFSVEFEYTSHGAYVNIDPEKVVRADSDMLAPFLQEKPPHIVFSDKLSKLSKKIVGDESNPYLIAQKLYQWINFNIPWASAREYSTISNIPGYCIDNKHGDCGIKALLFITLCRMNGIPAQWQSGWEFQPPGHNNMHDWAMIYFEPYGWIPSDVDYGLRKTRANKYKWFYLTGTDAYRLVYNDDFSQPFWPEKKYPRSETLDSQRGEVEWSGGNLFFDQWDWDMNWRLISE